MTLRKVLQRRDPLETPRSKEGWIRRGLILMAERAKGFRTNMPPPVDITEEEITEIIEYLKTLSASGGGS